MNQETFTEIIQQHRRILASTQHLISRLEKLELQIGKQEKQIGRLIQCIGEFELTDAQRYYLNKAIWGSDDD